MNERRVIVDTDTASDDSQALLMAVRSDRVTVEGVTVVAGNAPFEREVENAKYTLDLVDAADRVRVREGARRPLLKEVEHATEVHGEGGFGGNHRPETGIESADEHAVDYILRTVRADPGEVSLLCVGPLTNVALACAREPDLGEYVDEAVVMGGAVHCAGNVTPAAEYNFWVDPDAAKLVLRDLDVTLVDWGLSLRASLLGPADLERIETIGTKYSEFFLDVIASVRAYTRREQGVDGVTLPDSLAAALLVAPELREESSRCVVDVDEREGMTRGYSLVDDASDREAGTTVVESVDADLFREMTFGLLEGTTPERPL